MSAGDEHGALTRARALTDLGRHTEARTELSRHLAVTPNSMEGLCLLAMCELALGDAPAALRAADAAVAAAPYSDWALRLRALALSKLDRRADARESAEAAVRLDPNDFANHHTVAHVLHDYPDGDRRKPEELKRAREAALRAVELAPHEPAAHLIAGLTAGALELRAAERASYEEALRLDPNNAMAMNNLAAMDADGYRLGRATRRIVAGLRMDPQEEILRRNLDAVAVQLIRRVFNVMLLSGLLLFVAFGVGKDAWAPRAGVGALLICGYVLVGWLTLRHLPRGARRHLRGLPKRMTVGQRVLSVGLVVFSVAILAAAFAPGKAAGFGALVMVVVIRIVQICFVMWLIAWVVGKVRRR